MIAQTEILAVQDEPWEFFDLCVVLSYVTYKVILRAKGYLPTYMGKYTCFLK
jgi:hypothetical protein